MSTFIPELYHDHFEATAHCLPGSQSSEIQYISTSVAELPTNVVYVARGTRYIVADMYNVCMCNLYNVLISCVHTLTLVF